MSDDPLDAVVAQASDPRFCTMKFYGLSGKLEDVACLGYRNPDTLEPIPSYSKDREAMAAAIARMAERHGWSFQKPYVTALRAVVMRRRGACNMEQRDFWLAEATAAQRREAFLDALAIMHAADLTTSET